MYRRTLLGVGLGAGAALAGCAAPSNVGGDAGDSGDEADVGGVTDGERDSPVPAPSPSTPWGYTHLRPDGNRVVEGEGAVPTTDPVDVSVDGTPRWVVGVVHGESVLLVVVTDDAVVGVRVGDTEAGSEGGGGEVTRVDLGLDAPPGPPLLVGGEEPSFAPSLGSSTTHPVPTSTGWASVTEAGVVRLPGGENADVGALPDARIVSAGGRLYVLASRTRDYGHGVLGDSIEAGSVAVLDPAGGVEAELTPPSGVIEGISPLVADLDGDGRREVVVTASDASEGARLVALRESGEALVGPAIGAGFRWRHQLAVAPFGPGGETELAVVRTPHIGGVAEFYRARAGRLELVATLAGYSTHRIGSRNLDNAVAGDLDGDGRVELLVPDDPHTSLAGLRRVDGGVEEAWRVPLGGRLTSNLCAVEGKNGVVVFAAGRDGALRVWV